MGQAFRFVQCVSGFGGQAEDEVGRRNWFGQRVGLPGPQVEALRVALVPCRRS